MSASNQYEVVILLTFLSTHFPQEKVIENSSESGISDSKFIQDMSLLLMKLLIKTRFTFFENNLSFSQPFDGSYSKFIEIFSITVMSKFPLLPCLTAWKTPLPVSSLSYSFISLLYALHKKLSPREIFQFNFLISLPGQLNIHWPSLWYLIQQGIHECTPFPSGTFLCFSVLLLRHLP